MADFYECPRCEERDCDEVGFCHTCEDQTTLVCEQCEYRVPEGEWPDTGCPGCGAK